MEKKQRYRVFWFIFTNNSEDNKEFIKTLDYQYIMFYQAEDTKIISGYIRFKNQRLQKSVESKTFLKKATVNPETRSEKKIKALYSQRYKIYEYGTPTNQGARNDIITIPKSLDKHDQQIAKIDEEIAKIKKEHAKINEERAKKIEETDKKTKEIDKIIQTFQDYNKCNSEHFKQLTENCLTLAKSITTNNNETRKDVLELMCFVKGIEFEIQELHYNTKFDHMDEVKKIFRQAYQKLNSEMCPVRCTNITKEINVIE
jgi:hypothetical protein